MAADEELGLADKLAAAHEKHPASGGLRADDEGAMLPRSAPSLSLFTRVFLRVRVHVKRRLAALHYWRDQTSSCCCQPYRCSSSGVEATCPALGKAKHC